jgi:hypothetical protein
MSKRNRESIVEELVEKLNGPRGPINPLDINGIAQALGASTVIAVADPVEALALYRNRQAVIREQTKHTRINSSLAAEITVNLVPRLESSGGRPSVPEWTVSRVTGYAPTTWDRLQEIAQLASTEERKVSPAQIAGYIIERVFLEERE